MTHATKILSIILKTLIAGAANMIGFIFVIICFCINPILGAVVFLYWAFTSNNETGDQ